MLGLHRATQSLNQLIRTAGQLTGIAVAGDDPLPPGSDSAVDKIGVSADTTAEVNNGTADGGGLLEAVASLPQSVQQAAVQVRHVTTSAAQCVAS
jgi:hypothetical protein